MAAPTETAIRLWSPNVVTQFTGYNDSTEVLTIPGSQAGAFYSGRKFVITQGTGDYAQPTTAGSPYTSAGASNSGGNTLIVVSGGFTLAGGSPTGASGNKGYLGNASQSYTGEPLDYIDFDVCTKLRIQDNDPYTIFTNRQGLKSRINMSSSTLLQRFPHTFSLSIPINDMDIESANAVKLQDFLHAYCRLLDSELFVFYTYIGRSSSGSYTEKRCVKGYLEQTPGFEWGSKNMEGGAEEGIELVFTCTGDGTFTDWDQYTTATYRNRS